MRTCGTVSQASQAGSRWQFLLRVRVPGLGGARLSRTHLEELRRRAAGQSTRQTTKFTAAEEKVDMRREEVLVIARAGTPERRIHAKKKDAEDHARPEDQGPSRP